MKLRVWLIILVTHLFVGLFGFGLGIYTLPILTAPESPTKAMLSKAHSSIRYTAEFTKDRTGSDLLHWGEGEVSISESAVTFEGELAPGPDYRLYLTKQFVENESEFNQVKAQSLMIGQVTTFENFMVLLPQDTPLNEYNSIVVWCESFGEFITSARYNQ